MNTPEPTPSPQSQDPPPVDLSREAALRLLDSSPTARLPLPAVEEIDEDLVARYLLKQATLMESEVVESMMYLDPAFAADMQRLVALADEMGEPIPAFVPETTTQMPPVALPVLVEEPLRGGGWLSSLLAWFRPAAPPAGEAVTRPTNGFPIGWGLAGGTAFAAVCLVFFLYARQLQQQMAESASKVAALTTEVTQLKEQLAAQKGTGDADLRKQVLAMQNEQKRSALAIQEQKAEIVKLRAIAATWERERPVNQDPDKLVPPPAPFVSGVVGRALAFSSKVLGGTVAFAAGIISDGAPRSGSLSPTGGSFRSLEPHDQITRSLTPLFHWEQVPNAIEYDVQIYGSEETLKEYGKPDISLKTRRNQAIPEGRLIAGKTYFWRVEATLQDGSTVESNAGTFTTLGDTDALTLGNDPEKTLREVEDALRNDPLRLGIIYANLGLRADAEQQWRKASQAKDASQARQAKRFLDLLLKKP